MRPTFAVALGLFVACAEPDQGVVLTVRPTTPTAAAVDSRRTTADSVRRNLEITGGTLIQVGPARVAVSDADSDRVWFVDIVDGYSLNLLGSVEVPQLTGPSRGAVDDHGVLYVALRRSGELALIDVEKMQLTRLIWVCAEPRGVVFDRSASVVRVACSEGQVVSVDRSGQVTGERWPSDLRDLLVLHDGKLRAMTFRHAELVSQDGAVEQLLPSVTVHTDKDRDATFVPEVAWRSFVASDGRVVIAHQRAIEGPVSSIESISHSVTHQQTSFDTYTGRVNVQNVTDNTPACSTPVVRSALTIIEEGKDPISVEVPGVLPVDVAVSPDLRRAAIALPGSHGIAHFDVPLTGTVDAHQCATDVSPTVIAIPGGGTPVAVLFLDDGTLLVQTVSPSRLAIFARAGNPYGLTLGDQVAPGMGMFHEGGTGMACASCHPEGRDDGHVWQANGVRRRTQSLTGGLLKTAPFHWQGELPNMTFVMAETFVNRMGGDMPPDAFIRDMSQWLEYLPKSASVSRLTPEELALGRSLFESDVTMCTACHAGEALTDNQTRDVGTGGAFQTPSLRGVGARGPWLHDGRAQTLAERFLPSGGGDRHGNVSQLTEEDVRLLVGYLESL